MKWRHIATIRLVFVLALPAKEKKNTKRKKNHNWTLFSLHIHLITSHQRIALLVIPEHRRHIWHAEGRLCCLVNIRRYGWEWWNIRPWIVHGAAAYNLTFVFLISKQGSDFVFLFYDFVLYFTFDFFFHVCSSTCTLHGGLLVDPVHCRCRQVVRHDTGYCL